MPLFYCPVQRQKLTEILSKNGTKEENEDLVQPKYDVDGLMFEESPWLPLTPRTKAAKFSKAKGALDIHLGNFPFLKILKTSEVRL